MRSRRSFLACAVGSSVAVLGLIRPKTAGAAPDLTVTMQAEQLAERQRHFGEELLALLADKHVPVMDRLRAAESLGKLRFLPAIQTLVRYVDLEPEVVSGGRRVEVIGALGRYGNAAAPDLVRAYLAEGTGILGGPSARQNAILLAIRQGNTVAIARTYALGIAAEGDRKTKAMVEYFLEELNARVENRRPLHKPSVLIDARGS